MDTHNSDLKVYEEKVAAQLREVKSKLDEYGAHAKGKIAEAEVQTLSTLTTKHQEIEKKRLELKTAGQAKAAELRAEIDAELSKLKSSCEQLAANVKIRAATK